MKTITRVFWFFGRSGAGKTTLALRLCSGLADAQVPVIYLDGDEMRSTLCSDLGFGPEARLENHRRIAEIARVLTGQGFNVVVSTMAPEHQQRDLVVEILGEKIHWFYIHAPLDICIARDPKGLYRRALEGQVKQLINYPFDVPRPGERENYINTTAQDVEECYREIFESVKAQLTDFVI